ADRVSSRRSSANAYFLTLQTALVAAAGLVREPLQRLQWWVALAIAVVGTIVSVSWWLLLRNYRDLNRAKFEVINEIERLLPVAIFTEEWRFLKKRQIRLLGNRYTDLGAVERLLPGVFAGLYFLLFLASILT
ncbi:MAG TPA: hypothetical protein VF163_21875, partial [Micromonosporaceae bacterium]